VRDHFVKRLCELAETNKRIMLITGDLGFGVLNEFRQRFPRQFINAGIAEQNMTGIATGMALEGRIVFTYSIGNFSTLRCLEQIRNDACYHNANVKVISVGGGFSYGALGISHHATEDLTVMRSLPNITVVSPCGLWEAGQAAEAVSMTPGVCYVRIDKSAGPDGPSFEGEKFVLGKVRLLRKGSDCTIAVTGGILEEVISAADLLSSKGISTKVLSVHTIKPFDTETMLQACRETDAVFTVEEHTLHGGLGSIVAEVLMDNGFHPRVFCRIGLEAGFSSLVGSQNYLRKSYGIDAQAIADRILGLLLKRH